MAYTLDQIDAVLNQAPSYSIEDIDTALSQEDGSSLKALGKEALQAAAGIPVDLATGLGKFLKNMGDPRGASYFRERAQTKGKPLYAPEQVGDLRQLFGMGEPNWANELTQGIGETLPLMAGAEAALPARAIGGLGGMMARYGAEGGLTGEMLSDGNPMNRLKGLGIGTGLGMAGPVAGRLLEKGIGAAKKGVNVAANLFGKEKPFQIAEEISPLSQGQMARINAKGASGAPLAAPELQERLALAKGQDIPSGELLNSDRLKKQQEFLTRIPLSGASKPYENYFQYLNTEKNKIIDDLSSKAALKEEAQGALDEGLSRADEIAAMSGKSFVPENYLKTVEDIRKKFKGQLDKKVGQEVYRKLNKFLEAAPTDAPKNFQDSQTLRNVVNEIYQDAQASGDRKLLGALVDVNRSIDDDIAQNSKLLGKNSSVDLGSLLKDRNARFKDEIALNKLLGKNTPDELTLKDFLKNYQSVASKEKGRQAESLFREMNVPLAQFMKQAKLIPDITKKNYMQPALGKMGLGLAAEAAIPTIAHFASSPVTAAASAAALPLAARAYTHYLNSPRLAQRYLASLLGGAPPHLEMRPELARIFTGGAATAMNNQ